LPRGRIKVIAFALGGNAETIDARGKGHVDDASDGGERARLGCRKAGVFRVVEEHVGGRVLIGVVDDGREVCRSCDEICIVLSCGEEGGVVDECGQKIAVGWKDCGEGDV